MEPLGGYGLSNYNIVTRKRSMSTRKPRTDSHVLLESPDVSSPSTGPSSDYTSKQSLDSGGCDTSVHKKELNLNRIYKNNYSRSECSDNGRTRQDLKQSKHGGTASRNLKSVSSIVDNAETLSRPPGEYVSCGSAKTFNFSNQEGNSNGPSVNKLRKVKLKVGGVTHTLHAQTKIEGGSDMSSTKRQSSSEVSGRKQKLIVHENSDGDLSPQIKGGSFEEVQKKDFCVRKSKRVLQRRSLDQSFDGHDDDEIRYLERLKTSKVSTYQRAGHGVDQGQQNSKPPRSRRPGYDEDVDYASSRLSNESRRKSELDVEPYDSDFVEEQDLGSDADPGSLNGKLDQLDKSSEGKKEFSLTTRQRALQSSKNGSGGNGSSLVEFPNGLPPAAPRKHKDKLSEVEQQLKKAEAAQRRRLQAEKAARESEAEAIRKILGQDSSRKKREDKIRKRRDELAQERAANSIAFASTTVRWVSGPSGTTVIFPENVDIPSIFKSKPCSYPPPREKCAGPMCSNPYKYRDSKSNLPLCSLQCYRAVQQNVQQTAMCL